MESETFTHHLSAVLEAFQLVAQFFLRNLLFG